MFIYSGFRDEYAFKKFNNVARSVYNLGMWGEHVVGPSLCFDVTCRVTFASLVHSPHSKGNASSRNRAYQYHCPIFRYLAMDLL